MIDRVYGASVAGIRTGLRQLERSAQRIAELPFAEVSTGTSSTPQGEPQPSDPSTSSGGLTDEIVSTLIAKRFIQAQLGVIRTADELMAEVVNLKRPKEPGNKV
jgi:hypothetical protein